MHQPDSPIAVQVVFKTTRLRPSILLALNSRIYIKAIKAQFHAAQVVLRKKCIHSFTHFESIR